MPSFSLDCYSQGSRGGDSCPNANGDLFAFQDGALLDVQFDKARIAAGWAPNGAEWTNEAGTGTNFVECSTHVPLEAGSATLVQSARHQPAPEAAQAKACRFLGGEDHELQRSRG